SGDRGQLYADRLGGSCLPGADGFPPACPYQLWRFEEDAMNFRNFSRTLAITGVISLSASAQQTSEVRRLTLTEAVHLAVSQNRVLKIARLKVVEDEQKKAGQHASYFPSITNQSNAVHVTEFQNIGIPAGAFGAVGGALVPARNTL